MKMVLQADSLEQKRDLIESKARELGVSLSWERPGRAVLVCEEERRPCDEILRSLLLMKTVEGPSMWESLSELEAGQRT